MDEQNLQNVVIEDQENEKLGRKIPSKDVLQLLKEELRRM